MMDTNPERNTTHSRLEPELVPRRDVLGLTALWSAASAALFAVFGMIRLPKAAVIASPPKGFGVTLPENLATSEAFVPTGRTVSIFRDADGVYAISLVCTHLGCIVTPTATGFECPCHGASFDRDGLVTKGPAPAGLPWLTVTGSGDRLMVDEGAPVSLGTKVNT